MIVEEKSVSTFALIVDKLRVMDEAQLKRMYLNFFEKELTKEWEELTAEMHFGDATEDDIIAAIQKNRYGKSYV